MKHNIFFLFFILLGLFFSCEKNNTEDVFLKCFNENEQFQLTQLKLSFEKFIENNYEGSRIDFLITLRDNSSREFIFEESDSLLINKLHRDSFLNIACFFASSDNYEYYPIDGRKKIKERRKNSVSCDFYYNKKYHNCIMSMASKDSLTANYFNTTRHIQLTYKNLSLNLINSINNNFQNNEMMDYILIVEVYYFILINKFKEFD